MAETPKAPVGPEQYNPLWQRGKSDTRPPLKADRVVTLAMSRFKLATEAEAKTREAALDDWRFRIGEQWPNEIKYQREIQKRPCLTINRIPSFTRQVCNEQRQQRPSITVNPVGDGADVETAEVLQGLCRHVEVNSQAEIAYDTAFESMLNGGFGYFRLRTDYADDDTFQQELFIEWLPNPFAVYLDPGALKPDKSDARFGFITYDVPVEEYPSQYPDSELARRLAIYGGEKLSSTGDVTPGWMDSRFVRVAEYFHAEEEDGGEICLLDDGTTAPADEVPEGAVVVQRRRLKKRVIHWDVINGIEVLTSSIWPGRFIPIIEVVGDNFIVEGKRYTAGLVRDAKDPQRMSNYWKTNCTETIALQPRAPYIGTAKNFEQYQVQWQQANNSPQSYLPYEPDPLNGGRSPERQQFEAPIQAMAQMVALSDNDLKAVTGIYDASLGAPGPEQSAKAILARQSQAVNGNANWTDNLARAIAYCGRQLLDLFPKVYSAVQMRRIIKPDGSAAMVPVGANVDPEGVAELQNVKRVFDLGVGKYDVTVTTGPSFQSKRAEASASMLELVKVNPAVFPLIGDLLVTNMDWPHAQEIAKRLKVMLPPQLQAEESQDPGAALAQSQAQLQQLGQQHQQLAQMVQEMSATIKDKRIEQETQIRLQQMKNDAQIIVAEIDAKVQQAKARMSADQAAMLAAHDAAHELAMRESAPPPMIAAGEPGEPQPQAQE